MTVAGAGAPELRRGCAIHLYCANRDMDRRALYDADGDLLLLPQQGALTLLTELGPLAVAPGQIAIIPRGLVFSVLLDQPLARGYVAETYGRHFQLPERGPVGANGLADARHFQAPAAWYEDKLVPDFRVVAKLGGQLPKPARTTRRSTSSPGTATTCPTATIWPTSPPWAASTSTTPIRRSTPCCRPRSTSPGRTPWT